MKYFTMIIALFYFSFTLSQDKRITKTGQISFEASVTSFEEIKAKNDKVYCVLNIKTGVLSIVALINEFEFKHALMKAHFNDNYMESDRYPKAIFKGKIADFNYNTIGTQLKEFKLRGRLEMHGHSKEITTTARLRKIKNSLEISSDFEVRTSDFDVTIPSMVSSKISNIVQIKTSFAVAD